MKTAIVTGGNRGLGFLISQKLADAGWHVVIGARSAKNGEEAVAKIKAHNAKADIEALPLDVSSFASVRAFVEAFGPRKLDVLVNNAGIMTAPGEPIHKLDGLESTFATNHLGSALLSVLLLDKLRQSAPARIVNVASRAHMGFPGMGGPAKWDWENVNGEKSFEGVEAYKSSKLAMLWFNYELARRLRDKSVTVNAVCPGFVPETAGEHAKGFQKFLFAHVLTHVPGAQTAKDASDNLVFMVTDPALGDVTGQFYGEKKPIKSSPDSYDQAQQQKLWDLTWKLTGVDAATLSRLQLA